MIIKLPLRFLLSLSLVFSLFIVSLPVSTSAQTAQRQISADLQARLAKIEEKVEARRKELGIPGLSLAIVKDGEVILAKGFGYKNFEKKIPVTADTQFAIGSATKAFTALSVLMLQDEGELSLDDSPKKYLSYFKINDPDTDKNITIRDLLSHSSGLSRTDLAMITGKLNRVELIKVAGEAKPVAKLREKFNYQNIMFTTAGEIVAQAEKEPWEKFIPERIFKPLGMNNSTMSINEMKKAKDYSFGYDYNFDTKETRNLPMKNLIEIAPAGAINSSANDMAKWIQFVLRGGSDIGGKRLVSEKGYEEWTKPQMKIIPGVNYGLGWFLQDWKGKKVIQHGGNIDGFNSMVAVLPEEKLGFVLLTNVSASSLGNELMPIIWEGITGKMEAPASVAGNFEKEIGKYHLNEANFDVEVALKDGKLVALIPNQPTYILENVSGRKYKLSGAPDGFFVTFRDADIYLEQPQGNFTLPRVKGESAVVKSSASAKALIGKYQSEQNAKNTVEIREVNGNASLIVGEQQPYVLVELAKDNYSMQPLPATYNIKVKRDASGKVEGIIVAQPNGEFGFKFTGALDAPKFTVDEIMAKTIEALGGEANWRKVTSRVVKFDMNFENQGVKASGTSYTKAPYMSASDWAMTALGKPIATSREYFDGASGGQSVSFGPAEKYTGQRLEDVRYGNDFYGLIDWKKGLKSAEITGTEKVDDEDAYVVVLRPEKANEVKYYISTKTYLPLKKTSLIVSSTSDVKQPISEMLSDYRAIDGVMLPFKSVTISPSMGNIVTYIKEVKNNAPVDSKVFQPKK